MKVQTTNQQGKTVTRPQATGYFVLSEDLLQDKEFAQKLISMGQDPQKPKVLPVWFPSNDPRRIISVSYDRYSMTHGLRCRSLDGRYAETVDDNGQRKAIRCDNVKCPHHLRDCFPIVRLRVILPDARRTGVYQIDTRSRNNRIELISSLVSFHGLFGAKLTALDFVLELRQEEGHRRVEENGTVIYQKVKYHGLHLDSAMRWRDLECERQARLRGNHPIEFDESQVEHRDPVLHPGND